jgi:hypothetical protein
MILVVTRAYTLCCLKALWPTPYLLDYLGSSSALLQDIWCLDHWTGKMALQMPTVSQVDLDQVAAVSRSILPGATARIDTDILCGADDLEATRT